jgi:hypothetical protein
VAVAAAAIRHPTRIRCLFLLWLLRVMRFALHIAFAAGAGLRVAGVAYCVSRLYLQCAVAGVWFFVVCGMYNGVGFGEELLGTQRAASWSCTSPSTGCRCCWGCRRRRCRCAGPRPPPDTMYRGRGRWRYCCSVSATSMPLNFACDRKRPHLTRGSHLWRLASRLAWDVWRWRRFLSRS